MNYLILTILFTFSIIYPAGAEALFMRQEKATPQRIVKVLTANSFVCENGQRMRLIGLKAPDLPPKIYIQRDEKGNIIPPPDEINISVEEQALVYVRGLLEDKTVTIEYDEQMMDDHGYRLVYAYLPDGTMANDEILKMGFSGFSIMPPNIKYEKRLRDAYLHAKQQKRGLMGE